MGKEGGRDAGQLPILRNTGISKPSLTSTCRQLCLHLALRHYWIVIRSPDLRLAVGEEAHTTLASRSVRAQLWQPRALVMGTMS